MPRSRTSSLPSVTLRVGPSIGWADVWIRTASLNTIEARWEAADGHITSFELYQGAPAQHPTLRPHSMTLALVRPELGGDAITTQLASIEGARAEVPAVIGLQEPAFVFPNHEDHDYAKVVLDPVSLAFARERLADLDDPFLRQLAWSALWDMVRDARLSSIDYLAMVRTQAPAELDVSLLDAILEHAVLAARRYLPESHRAEGCHALVTTALAALDADRPDDDRRLWLRLAIAAASSTDDLEVLLDLADRGGREGDLPIDQDMRWQLAVRVAAMGMPGAAARVADEGHRDPSDRGQRQLIRAEVARPDADAKAAAWQRINDEGYGSDYLTRAALSGFQWHHQRTLLLPYREPFFERVPVRLPGPGPRLRPCVPGGTVPGRVGRAGGAGARPAAAGRPGPRGGPASPSPAGAVRRPGTDDPGTRLCRGSGRIAKAGGDAASRCQVLWRPQAAESMM